MNSSPTNPIVTLNQQTLQLIDLLLQERQAIAGNDTEKLSEIVSLKDKVLQDLVRLELQFRNGVSREGFSIDRTGIEAWLERQRLPLKPWHTLRACLLVVQELNAINGNIVSRTQRTTRRVLEILSGQTGSNSTYQANGLHSSLKLKRALGQA